MARCVFAGYEDFDEATNPGFVQATYAQDDVIQCISPPLRLNQAALTAGHIHESLFHTTIRVYVELLHRPAQEMFFSFTYIKGTVVTAFDPPNMHFARSASSNEPIEAERDLIIVGDHFLDIKDEMLCRIHFPDSHQDVESPARYISNHTLACPVPAPLASLELPYAAIIEVSFNQGQ